MANRIQLRRDTTANWEQVNPVLEDGEPGLDITQNKIKYGDGTSTWSQLPYASGGGVGLGNALVNGAYTVSLGADGKLTVSNVIQSSTGTLTFSPNIADTGSAWTLTTAYQGQQASILSAPQGDSQHVGELVFPGSGAAGALVYVGNVGTPFDNAFNIFSTGPGGGNLNIITNNGQWTFGADGSLTLPNGGVLGSAGMGWQGFSSAPAYPISIQAMDVNNSSAIGLTVDSTYGVQINNIKGDSWSFSQDSTTTLPGNLTVGTGWGNISMVDTIFANNYVYANGVSILSGLGSGSSGNVANLSNNGYTVSLGSDGNVTMPGSINLGIGTIGSVETADSVDLYGNANVQYVQLNWNNQNFVYVDSTGAHMQAGPSSPGQYEIFLATDGTTTFPDHKDVTITGNLTVGNLFVNGNSTIINTQSYSVEDNVIQIASGNPADTLDIGFVGHRTVGGTLQHTGLVRNAGINRWELFSNVTAQPGTTVDFTGAVLDDLLLGGLYSTLVNTNTLTAGTLTANLVSTLNLHITSTAPAATGSTGDKAGDIRVDGDYVYYCTADYVHDAGVYYTTLTADKNPGDAFKIQIAKSSVFGTPAYETFGNGAIAWGVTFVGGPTGYVDMVPVSSGNDWILDLSATPSVFGIGTSVTITNPNPTPDPVIWKRVSFNAFTETVAKFASNNVLYLPNSSYIEPSGTSVNWGVQGSFNLLTNDASSSTTHKWSFGDNGKITKTYGPDGAANLTLTSNAHDLTLTTTGNLIIPGNINYANGVSILAGIGNYSNVQVASYLSGNVSVGNVTFTSNTGMIAFNNGAIIYGDTTVRNGSILLQPAASGTFPSVIVGGAGRLAAPNGSVHVIFNASDLQVQVAQKLTSGTSSTSTTTGALQVTGGAGISGNINVGSNIVGNLSLTATQQITSAFGTNANVTINPDGTGWLVATAITPTYLGNALTVAGNVTVNGSTGITMPNRPAFRINGNTMTIAQTTSNVNLKGTIANIAFNQGGYYDNTTGKFTAPVAGIYSVGLNARVSSNNGLNQMAVLKNGNFSQGNVVCFWETDTNTGVSTHFGVNGTIQLAVGDYLSANIVAGTITFDVNDNWHVTYLG